MPGSDKSGLRLLNLTVLVHFSVYPLGYIDCINRLNFAVSLFLVHNFFMFQEFPAADQASKTDFVGFYRIPDGLSLTENEFLVHFENLDAHYTP